MEVLLQSVPEGIKLVLQPLSLVAVVLGVLVGVIIGAIPAMGPMVGMAVFLPFSIGFPPEYAILLFVGILVGSGFGNSIPAILMRVPGTASAVLTCVEGYEFQRRGEGGKAIGISLISSVIGQGISIFFFVLFMVPLVAIAINFMFPEKFALVILGLTAAVGLLGKSPVRGIAAVAIGLAIATIGPDPVTGYPRFSFGDPELQVGLGMVPVLCGILAISALLAGARQNFSWPKTEVKLSQIIPTSRKDWTEIRTGTIIGTIVGLIVGALPGAGQSIAAFIAYQQTRIFSKYRDQFGKGCPDAVAAVDAAQNAAVGGQLVPTLALGVPGAAGMVMLLAVLTIHGIVPGPGIIYSYPPAIYATTGGLIASTILLFPLGLLLVIPTIRIMTLSRITVVLSALVLCIVAIYTIRWSLFDVYVLLGTGLLGYVMLRFGFPVAPAALAVVLGGMLEENLRVGLVMTYKSWSAFFGRPAVIVILLLALVSLMWPYISPRLGRRKRTAAEGLSSSNLKDE
ncbi:tripartite tricarboxylate transporter permease [Chloroflexota bacterium]